MQRLWLFLFDMKKMQQSFYGASGYYIRVRQKYETPLEPF